MQAVPWRTVAQAARVRRSETHVVQNTTLLWRCAGQRLPHGEHTSPARCAVRRGVIKQRVRAGPGVNFRAPTNTSGWVTMRRALALTSRFCVPEAGMTTKDVLRCVCCC